MKIFGKTGSFAFETNFLDNASTPDGYVIMSEERPDINYIVEDNGDGTGTWIIDKDYYKRINKFKIDALIQESTVQIDILKDTIELEIQKDGDEERLNNWKHYRVLLTRVDTSVENMELPEKPK